ncbi:hypothetical protein ACFPRL_03265 [Pseudoclavibacter helvolus]
MRQPRLCRHHHVMNHATAWTATQLPAASCNSAPQAAKSSPTDPNTTTSTSHPTTKISGHWSHRPGVVGRARPPLSLRRGRLQMTLRSDRGRTVAERRRCPAPGEALREHPTTLGDAERQRATTLRDGVRKRPRTLREAGRRRPATQIGRACGGGPGAHRRGGRTSGGTAKLPGNAARRARSG